MCIFAPHVWHDSEPTLFDFRHIANLKMPLPFLPLLPPLCRLPSQSPLQVSPLPCFSLCSDQSYPFRHVHTCPPMASLFFSKQKPAYEIQGQAAKPKHTQGTAV